MARRKQVAATDQEFTTTGEAAQPAAQTATAVLEAPPEETAIRKWRPNPFPVRTVNLGGYKLVLQESRPDRESRAGKEKPTADELWQMQIKFGSGSKDDMPSPEVLDFIKSQTKTVTTREGEEVDVQMFHWNRRDQAWGMTIDFGAPRTSRIAAEQVFADVVSMVAAERGVGQERTPF